MFRNKLVLGFGDESGEEGLLIEGWDWATPTVIPNIKPNRDYYRLLAHDLVEHIGEQNGTAEDELRAFGAILFGRFSLGMGGTDTELGIEIGSFIHNHIEVPKTIRICPEVREYQDAIWEGILAESDYILTKPLEPKDKRVIMHWLSKGYMQAQRRYKTPMCLYNLYCSVTHHLFEALRCPPDYLKAVHVGIDIQSEEVHVRVKEHVY